MADGTLRELKETEQEERILDITLSETHERDFNILDASSDVISYSVQGKHYEIITERDVNPESITSLFSDRLVQAAPRNPSLADIFKRMVEAEAIHE